MYANKPHLELDILLKNCDESQEEYIIESLKKNMIFRKAKKVRMFIPFDFYSCSKVIRTLTSTFMDKSLVVFDGYPKNLDHPNEKNNTLLIIDGTHIIISKEGDARG